MRKLILLLFAGDTILIENPNRSWNNYKLLGKRYLCHSSEPGVEWSAPTSVKHSEGALCEALVWGNKTETAKIFVWVRGVKARLAPVIWGLSSRGHMSPASSRCPREALGGEAEPPFFPGQGGPSGQACGSASVGRSSGSFPLPIPLLALPGPGAHPLSLFLYWGPSAPTVTLLTPPAGLFPGLTLVSPARCFAC